MFLENVGMGDFQIVVAQIEALVQQFQLSFGSGEQYFLAKNLQQHFRKPLEFHDRAVVLLHELFDREIVLTGLETEGFGNFFLVVKQESVFAPAGDAMQRKAHPPEMLLARVEQSILGLGDELVLHQFL